jgi:hydroxymethylpyrimidine/phosphomethylpyrimidine kinase
VTSVLVIAGVDPSGGAGLTRDVEALTRFGVRALCAVTALTVQSDTQFHRSGLLSAAVVSAQIAAALATRTPGAVKIGMLGSAATVMAVAAALPRTPSVPLVLDPLLRSSSGGELLDAAGVEALMGELLPRAALVTPNLAEAATLLGVPPAASDAEMQAQGRALIERGAAAVLMKGGHAGGARSTDWLLQPGAAPLPLSAPRHSGTLRGTGCTLASAIAARLAQGIELAIACQDAKTFIGERWRGEQAGASPH